MKVLVTGASGFIGSNLIKSLLKIEDVTICVVDNLSSPAYNDLDLICKFKDVGGNEDVDFSRHQCFLIKGDIRDRALAYKVTEKTDVIVHLAGNAGVAQSIKNPFQDCEVNIIGLLNYLDAARHNNIKQFLRQPAQTYGSYTGI